MFNRFKKKLILLNAVLTGLILSVVVFIICCITINQYKQNMLEKYKAIQENIVYKLHNENVIKDSWLADLEVTNQLTVRIEDNGVPFLYQDMCKLDMQKEKTINTVLQAALSEGINPANNSYLTNKMQSPVYQFTTEYNIPYYASVSFLPANSGYFRLTLIQYLPKMKVQILKQILLFIGIDLVGIFALTIVSYIFVSVTLRPVEESQKRQSEFIAAASHDLRSPLAVIQSNASSLLIDGSDPKHFVPVIQNECFRMSRLIHDMLLLASSDTKSWQLRKSSIDTDTYLIELYDTFSMLCKRQEHTLHMNFLQNSLPSLYADKDRLTQVLGILIDNAISYSPKNTTITLRPYQKKSYFILEVEDHGIGISKEQKDMIFHRFYRTDKARSDKSHFGLGLSIAKELVELNSGKISIKDTPGGGSTFVIELPFVS
jgi:Signal transduction histidine kinase